MTDSMSSEDWLDMETATDIEIAMYIVRLMNGNIGLVRAQGNGNSKKLYVKMAKNCLEKMTNPFAKKMLEDKIGELNALYSLPAY